MMMWLLLICLAVLCFLSNTSVTRAICSLQTKLEYKSIAAAINPTDKHHPTIS
jgi:hypothetical protein